MGWRRYDTGVVSGAMLLIIQDLNLEGETFKQEVSGGGRGGLDGHLCQVVDVITYCTLKTPRDIFVKCLQAPLEHRQDLHYHGLDLHGHGLV